MNKNILFFGAAVFIVLICGCVEQEKGNTSDNTSGNTSVNVSEKGFLEGTVTIGPICPVERENVTCELSPEVYKARKIVVYNKDKTEVVKEANLDRGGNYKIDLIPGIYVADINHSGIDRSGDVPKEIEIKANQTLKLDIKIDTGIR